MSKVKKFFISTVFLLFLFSFSIVFVYAENGESAVVTATKLNLRSGPGITNKIVGGVYKNQTVSILGESGDWFKVQASNGTIAWASKQYLSLSVAAVKSASVAARGNLSRTSSGSASGISQEIIAYAKKFLGVKYVWGGMSPKGFDCSGFVKYIFDNSGIVLNRTASQQAKQGTYIEKTDLQPGDLVFFDTNGGHNAINHVGIYIGSGEFIQSSSGSRSGVVISDITQGFYSEHYMTARRVL